MAQPLAPEVSQTHDIPVDVDPLTAHAPNPTNVPIPNSKKSRKRTKTGCLTCRKRRIKCGEERPICNNCIKSKRNCEGYTQRVIFKHPVGPFRHTGPSSQDHGNVIPLPMALSGAYPPQFQHPSAPSWNQSLHPIAPRPFYQNGQTAADGVMPVTYDTAGNVYPDTKASTGSPRYNEIDMPPHLRQYYSAQIDSRFQLHDGQWGQDGSKSQYPMPRRPVSMSEAATSMEQKAGFTVEDQDSQRSPFEAAHVTRPSLPNNSSSSDDWLAITPPQYQAVNGGPLPPDHPLLRMRDEPFKPIPGTYGSNDARRYSVDGFVQKASFELKVPAAVPPPPPHTTMDNPDDDYYDVESDEDMEAQSEADSQNNAQNNLGLILALSQGHDDRNARSITTFLKNESNVLATYRPSATASPLMDPKAARIFCHFVTSTGPSLSIYERHPTNPSIMFSGFPVPAARQALWTYTLPTMALSNQGLLHAMLAVGSLHISKLQRTSPAPSLKHYHYGLRRVAKAISLPAKRQEITTLAATLLLGFYEVMTAEHSKWNSHLAGARQLVMEIDFAGMTKRIRAMRAEARARKQWQLSMNNINSMAYGQMHTVLGEFEDDLPDKDWEVNEDLISTLMGFTVRYDQHGQIMKLQSGQRKEPTRKDVENYKIQSDLYWWYCKQDVFQSMVSGNRLLMPYDRWVYCPPRGQIGRLDAIYATMDHLILLMARISDFGGKDQKRKKRAMQANGGVWKPPPGFIPPRPPAGARPSQSAAPRAHNGPPPASAVPNTGSSNGPSFNGMFPPTGPAVMPSAFDTMAAEIANVPRDPANVSPDPPPKSEDPNLELQTVEAEIEWQSIANAFEVFAQSIGPEYMPLPADSAPPITTTPFGAALQYRTHTIACIWSFYYTGRILLARMHPSMPPAAMVAAGIAAPKTAQYAQMIGRICAGLYYPQQYSLATGDLNPTLGAALIESTFTLFFAGVQYTDAAQRGWTVAKLHNIADLTGWQTSSAVAAGCEVAWHRAGLMGKGPPYTPTMDKTNRDSRVSGKNRSAEGDADNEEPPMMNNDRRFINVNPNARVHWALGLLGVEEDIKKLDLGID